MQRGGEVLVVVLTCAHEEHVGRHMQDVQGIDAVAEERRVVHVRVVFVFPPPAATVLRCTSGPRCRHRRRPTADPNLSAASPPRVLHHPRQDQRTSGLGRAQQCVFLGSGHVANLVFALAVESLI